MNFKSRAHHSQIYVCQFNTPSCSNASYIYYLFWGAWIARFGIVTRLQTEKPEFELRLGKSFSVSPHPSRSVLRPARPPVQSVLVLFSGITAARNWLRLPSLHLALELRMIRAKYLLPIYAFLAC